MTATDSSLSNWEEDELDNPLGHTEWVLISFSHELTVLRLTQVEDKKDIPWYFLDESVDSIVLLEGVTSICDNAFDVGFTLKSV